MARWGNIVVDSLHSMQKPANMQVCVGHVIYLCRVTMLLTISLLRVIGLLVFICYPQLIGCI